GQRLVTREGDLWRWDGFTAAAEGVTPSARRLAERNRLSSIEVEELRVEAAADAAARTEQEAAAALARAQKDEQRLRQLWREAQSTLAKTRDAVTAIERAGRETESNLASVAGARARAEQDLVLTREALGAAETALAAFAASIDLEPALAGAQAHSANQ